jgi:hypothetical protein
LCPKCDAPNDYRDDKGTLQQGLCIALDYDDDPDAKSGPDPDHDPDLLWADATCECYKCDWVGAVAKVANRMARRLKAQGMVKCNCCKGTGWVPAC